MKSDQNNSKRSRITKWINSHLKVTYHGTKEQQYGSELGSLYSLRSKVADKGADQVSSINKYSQSKDPQAKKQLMASRKNLAKTKARLHGIRMRIDHVRSLQMAQRRREKQQQDQNSQNSQASNNPQSSASQSSGSQSSQSNPYSNNDDQDKKSGPSNDSNNNNNQPPDYWAKRKHLMFEINHQHDHSAKFFHSKFSYGRYVKANQSHYQFNDKKKVHTLHDCESATPSKLTKQQIVGLKQELKAVNKHLGLDHKKDGPSGPGGSGGPGGPNGPGPNGPDGSGSGGKGPNNPGGGKGPDDDDGDDDKDDKKPHHSKAWKMSQFGPSHHGWVNRGFNRIRGGSAHVHRGWYRFRYKHFVHRSHRQDAKARMTRQQMMGVKQDQMSGPTAAGRHASKFAEAHARAAQHANNPIHKAIHEEGAKLNKGLTSDPAFRWINNHISPTNRMMIAGRKTAYLNQDLYHRWRSHHFMKKSKRYSHSLNFRKRLQEAVQKRDIDQAAAQKSREGQDQHQDDGPDY